MGETRIRDPTEVERKLAAIRKGGASQLHVVSDFDRTLTKAFERGERVHGAVALLREHAYLTPDYPERAFALYDHYHPIEVDERIPVSERARKMGEWWDKALALMVGCGMSLSVVEDIVEKDLVVYREGALGLLGALHERNIPVLVFSAALGDIIRLSLKRKGCLYPNVHIISNFFDYDKDGKVRGYASKSFVHAFNKDESQLRGTPYERAIAGRGNVLVLGDSIADRHMVDGMRHDTVLSVGFLNEKEEELLPAFSREYDAVITGDGPMDYALGVVKTVR
jgi:5'-nucleotidase